jgi:predicted GH43/DUF377 family glycosyl hydrolase
VSARTPVIHHTDEALLPDPARVIARLFLPGEELPNGRSRAGAVVARVLALSEPEVERATAEVIENFSCRHADFIRLLNTHASTVSSHLQAAIPMSQARTLLLGASFTAEYAIEGAALCNPSVVLHPDQRGMPPGRARVALSLRAIGEGHLSSLGFCTAIVGAGAWKFEPRGHPIVAGTSHAATWSRDHLRAVLADRGRVNGLTHSVLAALPDIFTGVELEHALAEVHHDLLDRPGSAATLDRLRRLVASAYEVTFADDVTLSQQVLLPSTPDESNGLEDARLVRFVGDDGVVEYRATYTAYDGRTIAPRLLTSSDLRTFRAHRLAGPAARNKGMALFPRLIGGRHWSLCRSDGESNCLARSDDGLVWGQPSVIQAPKASWEVVQVGNCGSPIETDRGWLVLTHGVGPMRTYAIGAMLLDLDDPTRVIAHLTEPLLQGTDTERYGYVPNVVYSCGGMIHEGRLWLPYGIGDSRIGVAWAQVDELLAAMRS